MISQFMVDTEIVAQEILIICASNHGFSNMLSAFFDLCSCFEFLSRHSSVRCTTILSMVSHFSGFMKRMVILNDILFWSWLQSQSSSNYLPFRKTLQIWGKQSRFRISFLSCWALRRVSSQVGQMGTLSKVKRMSLALTQVLASLDSFGVAICTHVATALDGGTKCWFELQYSSPAFFLICTEFNQLRWRSSVFTISNTSGTF